MTASMEDTAVEPQRPRRESVGAAIVDAFRYGNTAVIVALAFVCFAFSSANLSTLAMEHMASIAGTASSVQGVVATVGGAIIGFAIGRSIFSGSVKAYAADPDGFDRDAAVAKISSNYRRFIDVYKGAHAPA